MHGKKPSYKLAILTKLLRLYKNLNRASDYKLSKFLSKEFGLSVDKIDSVLTFRNSRVGDSSAVPLFSMTALVILSKAKKLILIM